MTEILCVIVNVRRRITDKTMSPTGKGGGKIVHDEARKTIIVMEGIADIVTLLRTSYISKLTEVAI